MPVASRCLWGGPLTELMTHHRIDYAITTAPCQGPKARVSRGTAAPTGGVEPPRGRGGRSSREMLLTNLCLERAPKREGSPAVIAEAERGA